MNAVMGNYKRGVISPVSGRGSWLFDAAGNRYLDFIAGIATSSLGHGHPALVGAVQKQAEALIHASNLWQSPIQTEVAGSLADATGFDKVFFCNSGTEANEAAIKLARKLAHEKHGPQKHEVLAFSASFHGRTYGGLTATAQTALHDGFGPMLPGFAYAPFGDPEAAKEAVGPRTAAVLVEPIQGEGGINPAPAGFLEGLRELCDEHDALLVFDEVQTGAGRTGRLYAFQGLGVVPDVLTSAKGLGGGVPVGAMLARGEAADVLGPGSHGSTFGGNPLAMAAVRAVLGVVNRPEFLEEVRFKGSILRGGLEELARKVPGAEVRGAGLLLGLDLGEKLAPEVVRRTVEGGVLVNLVAGGTVRLAPPLTVSRTEIRAALDALRGALDEALEAAKSRRSEPAYV